jgi:predicted aspartyl protease
MKILDFELPDENSVIIVNAIIEDKFEFRLALDTAATHTTIDSNILFLAGYELKNSIDEVEVETANGIIVNEIYEVHKIESMGIEKRNFKVQVYDFLAHGITSEYDGVIGLDFLRGSSLTLDFKNNKIIPT